MKNGDLSNVPSGYVYVDATSLFEVSLFGVTAIPALEDKIRRLLMCCNITIFLEKGGRVKRAALEKSGFRYTNILEVRLKKFTALQKKQGILVFASSKRADQFYRVAPLELSVEGILLEAGV